MTTDHCILKIGQTIEFLCFDCSTRFAVKHEPTIQPGLAEVGEKDGEIKFCPYCGGSTLEWD